MAKRRDLTPDEALVSNPFAALAGMRESLPAGEATPAEPAPSSGAAKPARGPARAIVRYQRKGRGGKEATLVEQLGLAPEQLDAWSRELKQTLGCGGHVDGEVLVFGGDHRKRLAPLLEARGVRRVTVS